jgi:antitoxin YefM
MKAFSYTAARENLAATMDRVCADRAPIVITRGRGQSVVMLSLEEYEALEETAYLLQSPANARRLMDAKDALASGQGVAQDIDLGE